jgi:peptidoglycan/LPS O-acetylase OafA/YrhL
MGKSESERPSVSSAGSSVLSRLNGRNNSLGLLRLAFAIAVIVSHAYPLGGVGGEPFFGTWGAQETIGGAAVAGFFAISGYLVLRSALSSGFFQFLWKRALRIFPGYWVALLVGVLAVGPVVWLLEGRRLGAYFLPGDKSVVTYLSANFDLSIGAYGVWDIFERTTPYGLAVGASDLNGSIWTLTYEWSSYLIVAALLGLGLLRFTRATVVITAGVFGFINALYFFDQQLALSAFGPIIDQSFAGFGFVFFVGASIGAYAETLPLTRWAGIACGVVVVVSLVGAGWKVIGFAALPYFLLWVAAALPKQVQWIGQKNDYSYGIYLYGFLIQQTTAYFGLHLLGIAPWTAMCIALAFGMAWLSWNLIERPALSLKSFGRGRRRE